MPPHILTARPLETSRMRYRELFERYDRLITKSKTFNKAELRPKLIMQLSKKLMTDSLIVNRLPERNPEYVIGQEGKLDCMFSSFVNALELVRNTKYRGAIDAYHQKRQMVDEAIRLNDGLRMYDTGFSAKMMDKYLPGYQIVSARTPVEVLKALFFHGAVGIIGHTRGSMMYGHALAIYATRDPLTGNAKIVRVGDFMPGLDVHNVAESTAESDLRSFEIMFKEGNHFTFLLPKGVTL